MRDATGAVESVLVLGGGSEIGEAIVRRLIAGRARRVVLAGRPGRLEEVAARLRAAGAETITVAWDATNVEEHAAVFARLWREHGDVDVVIAAAGVLAGEEQAQRDGQMTARVLNQNFSGLAAALIEAANHLRVQGHGAIVVLSSVAGVRARRANFVYGASKAGLDSFAQGLGDSLADDGVSVLVVRPGFVRTRMTSGLRAPPLSTTADAVAERVVAALRAGKHSVWAPAPMRWLMMVLRLLPRRLWRRIPI